MKPKTFSYQDFTDSNSRKYLYGINEYSETLSRLIDIDGFIDDFSAKKSHMDKPILRLKDVPDESLVVSCVMSIRPKTALQNLINRQGLSYTDYLSLSESSNGVVASPRPIPETRADYHLNRTRYEWIRSLLKDEESINTFDDLMGFRLSADLSRLQRYEYRVDEQYFAPFVQYGPQEVFVDGGCFDGLTSIEFSKRCGAYKKIHIFEPSARNMIVVREKLAELPNVHYHSFGLYEKTGTVAFESDSGSASKISENGKQTVAVTTLDKEVAEAVTFIKLDIEGAELSAIKGMNRHISNDHPKLAIAVYHDPSHFWKVPESILAIRNDYKVYLRHYTEGWTETIMYFIPS